MKSKRILWKNNSVLYAEHMNKLSELIEKNYRFALATAIKHGCGIISYSIDEILLSSGILAINHIEGIFQDGTIFEYDSTDHNYIVSLDLSKFSEELFYSSKKFYICKDNEEIEEYKEIVAQSDEIVPITYTFNKIKITDISNSTACFPICEIFIKAGTFNLNDFCPPMIAIKKNSIIGNLLNRLIVNLRQSILSLKEQILINEIEIKRAMLRDLNYCLVKLNVALINESGSFAVYLCLCDIIGKLSWYSMLMPNVPVYDHLNSYVIIGKLVLLIEEIVNSSRSGYDLIQLYREGDVFTCKLDFIGDGDILLVIEPNNLDIKTWIENTIITSESFFDDFHTRRFPGINREITDATSTELVVKLDKLSNYLVQGEKLVIFAGEYSLINRISLYFKK
jgi:predicted component of type VI protein secretion system